MSHAATIDLMYKLDSAHYQLLKLVDAAIISGLLLALAVLLQELQPGEGWLLALTVQLQELIPGEGWLLISARVAGGVLAVSAGLSLHTAVRVSILRHTLAGHHRSRATDAQQQIVDALQNLSDARR